MRICLKKERIAINSKTAYNDAENSDRENDGKKELCRSAKNSEPANCQVVYDRQKRKQKDKVLRVFINHIAKKYESNIIKQDCLCQKIHTKSDIKYDFDDFSIMFGQNLFKRLLRIARF